MSGIAVIDAGTNSTNLLVVDAEGRELNRTIASTRLGDLLSSEGVLGADAMSRTLDMITAHLDTARALGVDDVRLVGTAACRRARNTDQFSTLVRDATGLDLVVLSESDEASLSFDGALTGLPPVIGPTLVVDIGGGSTEYTVGVETAEMSTSIPFGAVTATATHLGDITRVPDPADLTNLIGAVSDELEEIGRTIPAIASPARVVGVAGTIVTVAAVEIGLTSFDDERLHGFVLSREAAEDVFRTVATEDIVQRRTNPGLPADRADIIVAGCCILVATMRRLRIDEIVVSTRNLLDGVARHARLTR